MEGKSAITRHFFKVLMPGFQEKLNLPPVFCKKLKEEKSQRAILKSRKGTWEINVYRNSEGLICLKDGWPEFVHNHSLSIGDFVLFEHIGELHFNVLVFDPTACEKDLHVESKREHVETTQAVNPSYHHKNTNREPNKETVISYHSRNPYFVLTMKPHHARKEPYVTIPAEFAKSNNLGRNTSVTLIDPRGRAWPVKLLVPKIPKFRCRMRRCWHDFYVSNGLKDGDVCVFDLSRRSHSSTTILLDVHIFPAPL